MYAALCDVVRRHPRHLVLAGGVVGLLAGPRAWAFAPAAAAGLACLAVAADGRVVMAVAVAGAVLAGALVAQGRLRALDRSRLLPLLGRKVELRGTLLEQPRTSPTGHAYALVELRQGPARGERLLARFVGRQGLPELPNVGGELQLAGRLAALRHPYDDFARDRGAHGTLLVSTSTLTGRTRGGLSGKLDGIRARAERALDAGLPATEGGLLRGMLLAEEGRVSEEVRSDFTRTGMRYLLAADGRKVMLLGALALPLLAAAGFSRGSRLLAVAALIAIYVPVAGARPSAQRAGVMGGAALFAGLAGRAGSRWYALLLAAAVTLTLQPRAAADAGWQLSFAAVATILVLAEPLRRRLIARGLPRAVADSSALTLAATLGVTPLLALHFDQVSLASLPANLLAAPAVAPVVWVGMLSATVGQVLPLGSTLLNGLNLVPLVYIEWIAHVAARLPGASVHAGGPVVAAALAGGPLLGFVLWRVLRRRLPVTRRRPPRLSRR